MNRVLRCPFPSSLKGVSVRRHSADTKEFPAGSNRPRGLKIAVISTSHYKISLLIN
ncbi:hypothetical protein EMIT0P260_60250 [Pseudomonas sp. IT-P260]